MSDNQPLVSIIIPTRDVDKILGRCLESISAQTYKNIEVIVIDNYSDDRTRDIAKVYGVKVMIKGPERSSQRNFGAKRASGEYLLFIDSDMVLATKVVEDCVKYVSKGDDAVIIPEITVGEGFWAKVRALERATYVRDTLFEAARFFKRRVFEELGGYDEDIVGLEDYDIQARLEESNYKVDHVNAIIIHLEEGLSLGKHLKKRYYYMANSKKYLLMHKERARRQFAPIRRSYMRHWKLLAKNPLYGIGLSFMKACEFIIGGVGLITSKFKKGLTSADEKTIISTSSSII